MTRLATLIVLATPTALALSREVSLRGAEVIPAKGAQQADFQRGLVQRGLEETGVYEGCFADTPQRVMTDLLVDDDMTSLLCLLYCKDKGAKYFATQNGNQCFCGYSDVVSDYTIHGSATCDEDCAGDDSIACGGNWALSLYKIDEDVEATTPVTAVPASYTGGQYGTQYSGDATYYGYTTQGNCGYGGDVPGMYSGMIPIALNDPQYGDSLMCGTCVEGTANGNGGGSNPVPSTFKGYITDKCPECSWGDLDFSMSGDGRWDIRWKFVDCPGESISFKFEGSNPWYWKVQPQGTKTPVESLTMNGQRASRTDDNHFVLQGGPWYGAQTIVTTTVAGVTQSSQASP